MDGTEHKVAEDRLREYESLVEASHELITVVDRQYRYLIVNRQYLKMRKLSRDQVIGHHVYELTGKKIFDDIIQPKLDACFQGKIVEYEMRYTFPDLGSRDLLLTYLPIEESSGVHRVACILRDITEQRQVSRRLIEMQEQERTRIARELHDNIGQKLGLVAINVDIARGAPPNTTEQTQKLLTSVWQQIIEIISDLHSVSYDLHSFRLEHLGISAAMRSFCRELSERQNVEIDFVSDSMPKPVPSDVSLCLFRVMQEAVHNAVKHGNSNRIEVKLITSGRQLCLTVSDRGSGFDFARALNKGGLGLTSMFERVRMVGGEIRFLSGQVGGTTVDVRVPLTSSTGIA